MRMNLVVGRSRRVRGDNDGLSLLSVVVLALVMLLLMMMIMAQDCVGLVLCAMMSMGCSESFRSLCHLSLLMSLVMPLPAFWHSIDASLWQAGILAPRSHFPVLNHRVLL